MPKVWRETLGEDAAGAAAATDSSSSSAAPIPDSLIPKEACTAAPKKSGSKKKRREKPGDIEIGAPRNFQQRIHVDFSSETGFSGLPSEWETLLKSSYITKEEAVNNPDEVLRVLEFHQKGFKLGAPAAGTSGSKPITNDSSSSSSSSSSSGGPPALPSDDSVNPALHAADRGASANDEPETQSDGVQLRSGKGGPKKKLGHGSHHSLSSTLLHLLRFYSLTKKKKKDDWVDEGDPRTIFTDLEKCGEGFVLSSSSFSSPQNTT